MTQQRSDLFHWPFHNNLGQRQNCSPLVWPRDLIGNPPTTHPNILDCSQPHWPRQSAHSECSCWLLYDCMEWFWIIGHAVMTRLWWLYAGRTGTYRSHKLSCISWAESHRKIAAPGKYNKILAWHFFRQNDCFIEKKKLKIKLHMMETYDWV